MALKENKDPQEKEVQMVQKVVQALQDVKVHLEKKDLLEMRVQKDVMERREYKDPKVQMVSQDKLDQMDAKDQLE